MGHGLRCCIFPYEMLNVDMYGLKPIGRLSIPGNQSIQGEALILRQWKSHVQAYSTLPFCIRSREGEEGGEMTGLSTQPHHHNLIPSRKPNCDNWPTMRMHLVIHNHRHREQQQDTGRDIHTPP